MQKTLFEEASEGIESYGKPKPKGTITIIDERVKQKKVVEVLQHDKKTEVIVKYGLDSKDERDFDVSCNDLGVTANSSGFGGKIGEKEKTLKEKLEDCLKWYLGMLIDDGYKKENIKVTKVEMTEEDLKKHEEWKARNRASDLKYAETKIERLTKELKEALKVKYGKDVILKVGVKD